MSESSALMKRTFLLDLFDEMGRLCAERGEIFEIALYGGSALILDFTYREVTRDIDFCIRGSKNSTSSARIKALASEAALRLDIQEDMSAIFRDDVSIFSSCEAEHIEHGNFGEGNGALRVFKASPRYILAMKALSMRNSMESYDTEDVWELMKTCNMSSMAEIEELVDHFYPGEKISKKNRFILQDFIEAQKEGMKFSRALAW